MDRQKLKEDFEKKRQKTVAILERVSTLLQRRQAAGEAAVAQFAELVSRHRRLQQADAETRRARHERRRADHELTETEDRRDAAADRLDQFQRAAASAMSEIETKTANYRKASAMLKTHMGIEVRKRRSASSAEPGTTTLVITMTRLDEQDPERPFHVQYTVIGSRVTLVSTKPSVGELTELQAALDESGNLGQCMAQLRARFQQVARQQAERRERRAARAAKTAAKTAAAAPAPV